MPHLTLEYSAGAGEGRRLDGLLTSLNRVTAERLPTDLGNCKARALRRERYAVGDGQGEFVHLDLQVLEGRSDATRRAVAEALLVELKTVFGTPPSLQITVDVHDVRRATYAKHPEGTLTPAAQMR